MNSRSVKCPSFVMRCAGVLAVVLLIAISAAFGQAGRGASSDDWFVKAEKDEKDTAQMGIGVGKSAISFLQSRARRFRRLTD